MHHHLPSAIHRPSLVVLGKRYYEVNMPAPPSLLSGLICNLSSVHAPHLAIHHGFKACTMPFTLSASKTGSYTNLWLIKFP